MQQSSPVYSMSLCDMCNMLRPICSWVQLDVINHWGSRSRWRFTICPRVTATQWAELTLSHWYSTRAMAYLFFYRYEREFDPFPFRGITALFCQVSVSIGSHAALWPGCRMSWCSVACWDDESEIDRYEKEASQWNHLGEFGTWNKAEPKSCRST